MATISGTELAELLDDARCLEQCIPPGFQSAILISLFARVAGVSADPATLMADARCINACVPPGMQMAVLISLASQILAAGGGGSGGGSGQIVPYTGADPNSDGVFPADLTKAAIAVKPSGTTYTWDKDAQTWDVP